VRFTFGNADRVMTQLANDTDLKYAEIDFCAYHVNSGILIQIWKGVIQNYTSDGTPNFPVTCSDGFFQIMNQYPERQASRQCWKTYNDGVYCPWATKGAQRGRGHGRRRRPDKLRLLPRIGERLPGARHGSLLRSPAGRPAGRDHQGRFHRVPRLRAQHGHRHVDHFTDTIWGLALPEIWCNSGGNPLYAFLATALDGGVPR
jgi:hypothetical protein